MSQSSNNFQIALKSSSKTKLFRKVSNELEFRTRSFSLEIVVMADPPMECIPKLKPYCSNRKAVIGWITFWMDTTFAKRGGKLGDPNLSDSWNPYKTMHNFYMNKCKAVAADTKNGAKTTFPPWSDK